MRTDTGSSEWAVFLRRLPAEPYRDGMTEVEARDFVDQWEATGGWTESFYVAKRVVGPWEFVDGAEPFGNPRPLVSPRSQR